MEVHSPLLRSISIWFPIDYRGPILIFTMQNLGYPSERLAHVLECYENVWIHGHQIQRPLPPHEIALISFDTSIDNMGILWESLSSSNQQKLSVNSGSDSPLQ